MNSITSNDKFSKFHTFFTLMVGCIHLTLTHFWTVVPVVAQLTV